jgi:methionine synthase II (cobalamin-independent)
MPLLTEPIGSIPRPRTLLKGMQAAAEGKIQPEELDGLFDVAVSDTLRRFEATGAPVVTDGEMLKPSFATYPVAGLTSLRGGGVTIPFEDGHTRVGVIDPIDPRVETPEEVRDRVLEAARFIAPSHLGTTDDCGFSPFGDDTSTTRDTAFAKIQARIAGSAMASIALGV